VVNAGCGGVRHNGLLVGLNCHELQRPYARKSSQPSAVSHLLICGYSQST
jgi:hypothetical protein